MVKKTNVPVYVCEKCGAAYPEIPIAEECEKSHCSHDNCCCVLDFDNFGYLEVSKVCKDCSKHIEKIISISVEKITNTPISLELEKELLSVLKKIKDIEEQL